MTPRNRVRVLWALSVISAALTLLTIALPEWIEVIFGVDPDHGSGTTEWAITVATGAAAVIFAGLGTWQLRRLRAT